MINDTRVTSKSSKEIPITRETIEFFKEAENYKANVDRALVRLVDCTQQHMNKHINCQDDLTRIPHVNEEVLETLGVNVHEVLRLFINLKAYFAFAKAIKTLEKYTNYQTKRSGQRIEVHYLMTLQKKLDGVDAKWCISDRFLNKRQRTSLRQTKTGNFPKSDFRLASQGEREIICNLLEPKLVLLREQTKEIGQVRDLLVQFLLLCGKYQKKQTLGNRDRIPARGQFNAIDTESGSFKEQGSYWLKAIDPQLLEFVFKANQFGDREVKSLPEISYFRDLSEKQLQRWEDETDKNIIFMLRVWRTILFVRAVKNTAYFYQQKQKVIELNKTTGRKRLLPYSPKVRATPNGIGACWRKFKFVTKAYGRRAYGCSDYVPVVNCKSAKSAFAHTNPELKALICDEVEPKFILLREQTAVLGDIKRILKKIRYLNEKFYQQGKL